jgi:hypothetical protein
LWALLNGLDGALSVNTYRVLAKKNPQKKRKKRKEITTAVGGNGLTSENKVFSQGRGCDAQVGEIF